MDTRKSSLVIELQNVYSSMVYIQFCKGKNLSQPYSIFTFMVDISLLCSTSPLGQFVYHHSRNLVEPESTDQLQTHCHSLEFVDNSFRKIHAKLC